MSWAWIALPLGCLALVAVGLTGAALWLVAAKPEPAPVAMTAPPEPSPSALPAVEPVAVSPALFDPASIEVEPVPEREEPPPEPVEVAPAPRAPRPAPRPEEPPAAPPQAPPAPPGPPPGSGPPAGVQDAVAHMQRADWQGCIRAARAAPRSPEILGARMSCALRANDRDELRATCTEMRRHYPSHPQTQSCASLLRAYGME